MQKNKKFHERNNMYNVHLFFVRDSTLDRYKEFVVNGKLGKHLWGTTNGVKNQQSANRAKPDDFVIVANIPEDRIEALQISEFTKDSSELSMQLWNSNEFSNVYQFYEPPSPCKITIPEFKEILKQKFGYKENFFNQANFNIIGKVHDKKLQDFIDIILEKNTKNIVSNDEFDSDSEGRKYNVISTEYERSPRNRAECIRIHGYTCMICGFNFEQKYGEIGKEYIQIHHIVPLSEKSAEILVDPKKDLIPVCCNCHAMLHRSKPALLPSELRKIYRRRFV